MWFKLFYGFKVVLIFIFIFCLPHMGIIFMDS